MAQLSEPTENIFADIDTVGGADTITGQPTDNNIFADIDKPRFPELGRRVFLSPEQQDNVFSGNSFLQDELPDPFGPEMGTIVGMGLDPDKTEADINSALYYSVAMDMPFEKAYTLVDQLNQMSVGREGRGAWDQIKSRYKAGKAQVQLGDLGYEMVRQSWSDPDAWERNLKEIEAVTDSIRDDDFLAEFRGFWEKNIGAFADIAPQILETAKVAPKGAVLGGVAGGITAAIAG